MKFITGLSEVTKSASPCALQICQRFWSKRPARYSASPRKFETKSVLISFGSLPFPACLNTDSRIDSAVTHEELETAAADDALLEEISEAVNGAAKARVACLGL